MIDLVCPECGDEAEIDETELSGVDSIGCEECGAEFAFTLKDGAIVAGEILEEGECRECENTIAACECDGETEGETAIEVEDEDGDA